jgi:Sulfotransferase family
MIKEPNGSVGAPLLTEALPESRMILLVRDPSDVISSLLDAAREGGLAIREQGRTGARRGKIDRRPNSFLRERANMYRRGVESAGLDYDAHEAPKVLVRYEELRADTLSG